MSRELCCQTHHQGPGWTHGAHGAGPRLRMGPLEQGSPLPPGPQQPSAKASVPSLGTCLGLGWEWGTSL